MPSNSRSQLEKWLKDIEVKGKVLDVGGVFMPIKGRTKTWEASDYKILDIKPSRHSIIADYVYDVNEPIKLREEYDIVFCIEVMSHVWNPVQVMKNLHDFLVPDGTLYLSFHTLFPQHLAQDSLRYTKKGIIKIMEKTDFIIWDIVPKIAAKPEVLHKFCKRESKVYENPGEIGYLVRVKRKTDG